MRIDRERMLRHGVPWMCAAAMAVALGCEGNDAHATAPRGSDAFARFEVIGGASATGAQSAGLVTATQATAWPALLAAAAGVVFTQPVHRSPGCAAPLVAPLLLGERLNGTSITAVDSACTAAASGFSPPGSNLAIGGATAWDALHLTPKMIGSAPAGTYGAVQRARYAAVLALTQSQVTAMLVSQPSFVAVELGLGEVVRAATSGLVVPAADYGTPANWTLAPAAVATPVIDAIADSVAKSGARAVLVSAPVITKFPAFQSAADVWGQRSALATYGVFVNGNCSTSGNLVNVAALVPALAVRAVAAGAPQTLSCADVPGAADGILTPADVAAIESAIGGINDHLKAVADAHHWAWADLGDLYDVMAAAPGIYSAAAQLTCGSPYGAYLSLDGINPTAAGQQRIADAVATAINDRYGFALPIVGERLDVQVDPCAPAAAARDEDARGSSFVREPGREATGGPRHGARAWLH
ncbi:MAG TPA: hypothetical protein VG916_09980 [Gemmatimonadaceae bacterium]|nr:hypothetical protein [Gemmatimonadaceae bacterium]